VRRTFSVLLGKDLLLPRRGWVALSFAVALFMLVTAARIATPFIFAEVVTRIQAGSVAIFGLLALYGAVFFGLRVFEELRFAVYVYFEQELQKALSLKILRQYFILSFPHVRGKTASEFAIVIQRGLGGIRSMLYNLLFSIAPLTLEFTALVVIVGLKVNWSLAALAGGTLALFAFVTYRFSERIDALQRKWFQTASVNFKILRENIHGFETLRSFGRTDWAIDRYRVATDRFIREVLHSLRPGILMGIIQGALIGSLVYLACRLVLNSAGTLSEALPLLVLVNGLLLQIVQPMLNFAGSYRIFVQGLSSAAELFEMLTGPTAQIRVPLSKEPNAEVGFELENVTISYDAVPVIEALSLTIGRTGVTTIVGPSGSGKSTLGRALAGLQEYEGRIISGYDPEKIFYVTQVPDIFDSSLLENITLDTTGMSKSDIDHFLRQAGFSESELRTIEDRDLGEGGQHLSGGQRGRVGFARALWSRAEVLILDEPTSALDPEGADALCEQVKALSEHFKIIVITHDDVFASIAAQTIRIERAQVQDTKAS